MAQLAPDDPVVTINKPKLPTNKAVSVQLGKTGFIYNLVYDYKFRRRQRGFNVSVGSNFGRYLQLYTAGVGYYYLFGKRNRFFEAGINYDYFFVFQISDDQWRFSNMVYRDREARTYFINGTIGYRAYGRKTLFRAGLAPGFTKDRFLPGALHQPWAFVLNFFKCPCRGRLRA